MKKILCNSFILMALLTVMSAGCSDKEKKVRQLAKDAFIYAFPTVEHNKAVWQVLKGNATPVNRFVGSTDLYTHENRVVVSPNNDTFYSYAVLDIRKEPVIIKVPEIEDRYFCIQLCDIFTNCPDYISTMATGDGPGSYMVATSDWNGVIPDGVEKIIKVPASLVLAIVRTQVFGHDDEMARTIAQNYKAVSLSEFTGNVSPAADPLTWPDEPYDGKTGDTEGFFGTFNNMIKYQLLNDSDKAMMRKFKAIGIVPGKEFNKQAFTPEIWEAIESGAGEGRDEIKARLDSLGENINNWMMSPRNAGRWGTDYPTRAAAAWKYIYVNTPEEAIYLTVDSDGDGRPLSGKNEYAVTFSKEQLPQVEYFWSLTMYSKDGFLVDNPIKRYNIKDRDPLAYGEDGSLTLYIQKNGPGKDKGSNWLPAPGGEFYMILRLYGPSGDILEGAVKIPPVTKMS